MLQCSRAPPQYCSSFASDGWSEVRRMYPSMSLSTWSRWPRTRFPPPCRVLPPRLKPTHARLIRWFVRRSLQWCHVRQCPSVGHHCPQLSPQCSIRWFSSLCDEFAYVDMERVAQSSEHATPPRDWPVVAVSESDSSRRRPLPPRPAPAARPLQYANEIYFSVSLHRI
jgi:hypothetical protein